MNRSKREIKTPKRFDDEPIEKPRKAVVKQQPVAAIAPPPTAPKIVAPIAETTPVKIKLPRGPVPKASAAKPPPIKLPAIKFPAVKLPPLRQPQPPRQPPQVKLLASKTLPEKIQTTAKTIAPKTPLVKSEPIVVKTPTVKHPVIRSPAFKGSALKTTALKSPAIKSPIVKSLTAHTFKKRRAITQPVYDNLIPNLKLPFWDARTAADEHEDDNVKELVHCHCGILEELGLMIQCETCLTWQHALCLGIDKPEDAPDGYTCQACSNPKFARDSMRWAYDQDWLLKGKMKKLTCDTGAHEQDAEVLQKINKLINDALKIYRIILGLRAKHKLLQDAAEDEDSDMKISKEQWITNYTHRDGTPFTPTTSNLACTPDPGDLSAEAVADLKEVLPDIGQLDVSAILGSTEIPDTATNDCKSNLKLNIKQTEEFIQIELSHICDEIAALEKQIDPAQKTNFGSLKSDLESMRRYMEMKTA